MPSAASSGTDALGKHEHRPRDDEIDITVPNIARMYDYYLGGKDNYIVDRETADEVIASVPITRDIAWGNREFLGRVVRFLAAGKGIEQFLDIGSGLPSAENVHQVAQRANPAARVVYVDIDPFVLVHARAILAPALNPLAIRGDVRKPADILTDPELLKVLDLSRPVAVLLIAVLHFVPDDQGIYSAVGDLVNAMAPGSYLVISHVEKKPELVEAATVYNRANAPAVLGTQEEIGRFFGDLPLVDPGLVNVRYWRPDTDPKNSSTLPFLAGVGMKPLEST